MLSTHLIECFKQKSLSFFKVTHMHATNRLAVQDQACHWVLLREILED